MLQDIDPKAANYNVNASKIVYSADKHMTANFALTLRDRQASREITMPKGNGYGK
jgi:hypothetical protein